ncbi:hypothetical protein [Nocardia xishanensis]|uniref:hypothetical protein n=1 Tax=Nocardia xishanensis TaxID=238964 RepID=UPI0009FCB875|nr:hypothetical protein [Nocardia xishanensis]
MNTTRTHRLGVITALAFTGPIAAAGLLACTSDDTASWTPTPSSAATVTPPTGLAWRPFQGIELPVADQGPRRTEGPVTGGFVRSPAGAALAAIHAAVRMSIAPDSQWAAVGQQMLAPGPGRDAWATARAQISITTPITAGAPKILGYQVTRYTLDATDVEIYSRHPDNSLTRNTTHVVWQREDWRLRLPDNPTANPVTTVPIAPADMVTFPPR